MTRRKIVVATGNAKKLKEIRAMLGADSTMDATWACVPQSDFDFPEAIEDGLSFVENAIKKARHAARHTGLPALADDSGLEVDALRGKPGIYSARYAGEHASDADNVDKLLSDLAALNEAGKLASGRFRCVMALIRHADDPSPIIAEGSWEGVIVESPAGDNGFGYDPVFYVPQEQCTAAQLSDERKNMLSHRGQALSILAARLTHTQI